MMHYEYQEYLHFLRIPFCNTVVFGTFLAILKLSKPCWDFANFNFRRTGSRSSSTANKKSGGRACPAPLRADEGTSSQGAHGADDPPCAGAAKVHLDERRNLQPSPRGNSSPERHCTVVIRWGKRSFFCARTFKNLKIFFNVRGLLR